MNHSAIETEAPQIQKKKCHPIVEWLDESTADLLNEIKGQDFWKAVTSPTADPGFVAMVTQEVYLEIVGYQPHVIEAAIASIGQFPRSMKPCLVKAMLAHQADEFDHGEMALRDFVGLGGSELEARKRRMSPESFDQESLNQIVNTFPAKTPCPCSSASTRTYTVLIGLGQLNDH